MNTPVDTNEQRACLSKKKYGTKELAQGIADASKRKLGTALRVYGPCFFCAAFHLTSRRSAYRPKTRPKSKKVIPTKFSQD